MKRKHLPVSLDDPRFSKADSIRGRFQRIAYTHLVQEHEQKGLLPTSIRYLMYELEQLGLISKEKRPVQSGNTTARQENQNLIDAVTWLRNERIIPWDWIVDEGRNVIQYDCAPTIGEYLQADLQVARIDPWIGVPKPMIICESKAVAGILDRAIGFDYLVPIVPLGGNVKGFLINKVVPILAEGEWLPLYLGDKDDCGGAIEHNTRLVLEQKLGKRLDNWTRLAITQEQSDELHARGILPILKKDDRYNDKNYHEAYECEALGQGYLIQLVTETLDGLLPEPLEVVQEREDMEREQWEDVLSQS